MPVALKDMIENYARRIKRRFTLDEICHYIKVNIEEEIPQLELRIENLLEISQYVFHNSEKKVYIPRSIFFQKKQFIIKPTDDEIKNKILIPGHRFLPFGNIENFPGEFTLILEDDTEIPRKKIRKKLKDLYIYLRLLDLYTVPQYLIFDDERNEDIFKDENYDNKKAFITVFNLAAFYDTLHFTSGDVLLVDVLDWDKCHYRLNFLPAAEVAKKNVGKKKWIHKMDSSFVHQFNTEGIIGSIDEQIARAFFTAGKYLSANPCIHLGGYLAESKLVQIASLGERNVLWFKHQEPGFTDLTRIGRLTGDFESLEDIFHDISSPVTITELEAFMRNELYHRTNSYENILRRSLDNEELEFFDEYQEKKCFEYIREFWEQIKQEYNFFTDQAKGEIRSKAIDFFMDFRARFKDIELKNTKILDFINSDDLHHISQILSGLLSILGMCNEETNDEDHKNMTEILDFLEYEIIRILDNIEQNTKPELSLLKPERQDTTQQPSVYVLKISLKEAKPPIWRRLQIPGICFLGDLHEAIQVAFGWENNHLHEFIIGKENYGELHEEAMEDVIDEWSVNLSEVIQQEKQKFLYIYDFGDNWVHQIVVEKIISATEIPAGEKPKISCLAGKRACPPEDCGGIWGYETMLEALKDKKHPQHREFADWLNKDFDPEYFDLAKINQHFTQ